ncbi:hypothetical protein Cgig2_017021 [Carnegiea gigantea]|uniref:Uncharacterized protein n=1 Tax=Carnegiea gigantea TaxID=171969 RepID=A0A9Q1KIP6_9CARY|nr:hypothetical protein Cgig2_017021 [Carnegiea gigantea]
MDGNVNEYQEILTKLEIEAEHLLLARHQLKKVGATFFILLMQVVENDRLRNGNREALTALRKKADTTKTSVPSPFESIMKEIGGAWFQTIDSEDQERLDFEAKKLQSIVKEQSLIISEKGALSDKINPGILRYLIFGGLRAFEVSCSYHDPFRGAIAYFRVGDGTLKKGDIIYFMTSGKVMFSIQISACFAQFS